MERKRRNGILLWTLGALCASALLAFPVRADGEDSADFIVKLRNGGAEMMGDGGFPFAVVSAGEMKELRGQGLLEWYEPDGEAVLLDEPETVYYESYQWNLDVINAKGAFEQGALGQGVRVGVVDSGVSPHADLAARLLPGRNYIEDAADAADTADSYGHGTRVAGLIAGAGERGYLGAAPMAELVPLKVTDGKSVRISAVCKAIYGAVDEFDCGVVNLSLGINGEYESLKEAIEYAEEKNVTVVAAAGNDGGTTLYYPAAYDTVIGVGAVDSSGTVSGRSNHNSSVFLTAPGVEVRSTNFNGGYSLATGTSFSTPQVSGAAAVLLGMYGEATPAELREILAGTAKDAGAEGYDFYYGWGILDLTRSVEEMTERLAAAAEPPCVFLPESGPASGVKNNTGAAVTSAYLLAVYDENGRCAGVQTFLLTIPAYGTAEIAPPAEGASFGQFLCDAETLRPLCPARKTPVPEEPAAEADG